MKYADLVIDWLKELGYSHCFFVAGGNSMHLLDGARRAMTCVPVVHEVAAGIAVEYFNETARARGSEQRAFALVTAGPGLTNILTAFAGAFVESREMLVLGGQVKSTDLATEGLRQRGIQEIDGVALTRPVAVVSERVQTVLPRATIAEWVRRGSHGRPGPVFLEFCLDVQGAPVNPAELGGEGETLQNSTSGAAEAAEQIRVLLEAAERPLVLFGGGLSRVAAAQALPALRAASLPVMTTWNGADRIGAEDPVFAGRPNTWGQRSANVLVQQCDLLVALGTRLGLQQTGFNWQQFVPAGKVIQVDIDPTELAKGHPRVDLAIEADAAAVLAALVAGPLPDASPWLGFVREVRACLPVIEDNETREGYLDPYRFVADLSPLCGRRDVIVPCSSGGAFTVTMQAFDQQRGQTIVTDKGLASMGYGLSGAIGASFAAPGSRTVLIEGDGGFTQNLQELATVAVNDLPVKIFLFSNEGYASIRMTQRNYFDGHYLGCDTKTGLGFPDWGLLFRAYGIACLELGPLGTGTPGFDELFNAPGPAAFVVPIDPEQTYFPKITSRVTEGGGMESAPLHLMSPDLSDELAQRVFVYLRKGAMLTDEQDRASDGPNPGRG